MEGNGFRRISLLYQAVTVTVRIINVLAVLYTAQKAMKDEKIESRLANDTRNTRYVFHCSPVVKHSSS